MNFKQNYLRLPSRLDTHPDAAHSLSLVRPKLVLMARKGAISALYRGPRVGGEIVDTQIILHALSVGRGTADSFIMSAAAQCVQKVMIRTHIAFTYSTQEERKKNSF